MMVRRVVGFVAVGALLITMAVATSIYDPVTVCNVQDVNGNTLCVEIVSAEGVNQILSDLKALKRKESRHYRQQRVLKDNVEALEDRVAELEGKLSSGCCEGRLSSTEGGGPVLTSTPATTSRTMPSSSTPSSTVVVHPTPGDGYDYAEVLHKSILFYEAQRSGALPSTNRVPWRKDSALQDGNDVGHDLTGGWYDAGDYVKFGFPMAAAVTTLAWGVLEFPEGYKAVGEYDKVLDSIRWPLEYFIKCHVSDNEFYGQVGDGHVDHAYWGRPEDMTMVRPAWKINENSPGSDLAGETAAALAAGHMVFKDVDSNFAETLLDHSRKLYNFAYTYRGVYSNSISNARDFYGSSGYEDELAWGALWLFRATNEDAYLGRAQEFHSSLSWTAWAFSWDSKVVGAQLLWHLLDPSLNMATYVNSYLDAWMPGGSIQYTPQGLAWRDTWGANRYAANSAFIALVAEKYAIRTSDAGNWAGDQIGYMLGDGPHSFVVGFGQNPPEQPHHASSSCPSAPDTCNWNDFHSDAPNPHSLEGALVGGPDKWDNYEDVRSDYVRNEVACDYNAGFQGAVAGLIARHISK